MKTNKEILESIKGQLIVSCQALPEEPLHSSFIMGRMAKAAELGGAKGIRSNSVEDIMEIKKEVDLPIIGIIKKVYDNSDVFITPTIHEVELLNREGVDIIAMDATNRIRPDGNRIQDIFPLIREKFPKQLFMADCSNYEDAVEAYNLGFDCIGTTLCGYTEETKSESIPSFDFIQRIVQDIPAPIIAEGGIWTPEQLKTVFDIGVYAAVVGTAITRPKDITRRFIQAIT